MILVVALEIRDLMASAWSACHDFLADRPRAKNTSGGEVARPSTTKIPKTLLPIS